MWGGDNEGGGGGFHELNSTLMGGCTMSSQKQAGRQANKRKNQSSCMLCMVFLEKDAQQNSVRNTDDQLSTAVKAIHAHSHTTCAFIDIKCVSCLIHIKCLW